jgi:hypothetical protein
MIASATQTQDDRVSVTGAGAGDGDACGAGETVGTGAGVDDGTDADGGSVGVGTVVGVGVATGAGRSGTTTRGAGVGRATGLGRTVGTTRGGSTGTLTTGAAGVGVGRGAVAPVVGSASGTTRGVGRDDGRLNPPRSGSGVAGAELCANAGAASTMAKANEVERERLFTVPAIATIRRAPKRTVPHAPPSAARRDRLARSDAGQPRATRRFDTPAHRPYMAHSTTVFGK